MCHSTVYVSSLITKCIYLISWLSFECSQEKSRKQETTQLLEVYHNRTYKKRKPRKPRKTKQNREILRNTEVKHKNYEKPKRTKRKPPKKLKNPLTN